MTKCGYQPAPTSIWVDNQDRMSVVQAVIDRLEQTPLLTSQALADQLGLSSASIVGVMIHLSSKGLVESVASSRKKRQGKRWRLLLSAELALASFNDQPVAKACSARVIGRETGITEEDQRWMTHYRTQYQQRYLRNGQNPPITQFT